jgi:hypothetical protein
VRIAARRYGLRGADPGEARSVPAPPQPAEPEQLTLL